MRATSNGVRIWAGAAAVGLWLTGTAPAAAPALRVPYRLTETQHLLIRARVNGKGPLHFIVDTGAPAVYLSKDGAARVGVAPDAGGWGTLPAMELEGGLQLGAVPARIEEPPQLTGMNAMGLAGTRLDGVLGYQLLARYRMEFDLAEGVMEWTKLEYEPPPLQGLKELTGGKPVALPGAGALETISRLAGMLLRRPPQEVAYRGYLGLELTENPAGPMVAAVLPGSPAAQAGVKPGDRVAQVAVGGAAPTAVRTTADVLRAAAAAQPGAEVVLQVQRGTDPLRLAVRAGKEAL
jgi:hypothetical protein